MAENRNYFKLLQREYCVCVSTILSDSRLVPTSAHTYSHVFSKFYFFLVNNFITDFSENDALKFYLV